MAIKIRNKNMALIKCPECGTEVSDKAEKCPKCAFPIKSGTNTSQVKNDSKTEIIVRQKEGCFLQTLNFGCALIGLIIIIIVLIAYFS